MRELARKRVNDRSLLPRTRGNLIEGERERGVGGQRALKSDLQGFIGVLATNGC